MGKLRILIVDDEVDLLDVLQECLIENDYEVNTARDGEEALLLAEELFPDLVILDIRMPRMDGYEVCRRLREGNPNLPVIFLSALRQDFEKIRGFETGADDYITKPFSMGELLARIKSLFRRTQLSGKRTPFQYGEVILDRTRREVIREGQPVNLTPKEFDLLCYLVEREGEVIGRDQLLKEVWKFEGISNTRTVDNHIVRLRKKLEKDPSRPRYILTMQGVGYKFVAD